MQALQSKSNYTSAMLNVTILESEIYNKELPG